MASCWRCCCGCLAAAADAAGVPRRPSASRSPTERAAVEARYKAGEADCRAAVCRHRLRRTRRRRSAARRSTRCASANCALDEAKRKAEAEENASATRRPSAQRPRAGRRRCRAPRRPRLSRAALEPPARGAAPSACVARSQDRRRRRPPRPSARPRSSAAPARPPRIAQAVEQRNARTRGEAARSRRRCACRRRCRQPAPPRAEPAATLRPAPPGVGCRPPRGQASGSMRSMASDRLSPPPRARWRALLTSISLASRGGSACRIAPSLLGREVVPQAVAAGQQRVAELQPLDLRQRDRRVLLRAQAAGQQVALRMRVSASSSVSLPSSTRRCTKEWSMVRVTISGAAEVVDARVAGVDDVAVQRRVRPGRPPACCAALPRR